MANWTTAPAAARQGNRLASEFCSSSLVTAHVVRHGTEKANVAENTGLSRRSAIGATADSSNPPSRTRNSADLRTPPGGRLGAERRQCPLEPFDRFWPSLRIQCRLYGELAQGQMVLRVCRDRPGAVHGSPDVADSVLEPPELDSRSERRYFVVVVASVDQRYRCVTPIGQFHQPSFVADHGETVDDANRPFDVAGLDRPPVSLAKVGQLAFHEIGPVTELRSDAAGTDRPGELGEPHAVPLGRLDALASVEPVGNVLADRFEHTVPQFAFGVLSTISPASTSSSRASMTSTPSPDR